MDSLKAFSSLAAPLGGTLCSVNIVFLYVQSQFLYISKVQKNRTDSMCSNNTVESLQ